jgi:energy-coupling factor transporter transmembrane protein EcfT
MVDGNIILFVIFVVYGFIFLSVTTIVTWFLSKKFPKFWLINKMFVVCFLVVTVPVTLGIVWQNYYDSTPNGKFQANIGYYPNAEIKDLQVFPERRGDHEQNDFVFIASQETVNRIVSKCFFKISETEAKEKFSSSEADHLKDFIGKPNVRYYEKPAYEIAGTGCLGEVSPHCLAYDSESGNVYYQWNFEHF